MKNARRRRQAGFTLVELLVVVLIIGILGAIMIPGYNKTVESSKADDAAAVVTMLGQANKMYRLDNGAYITGTMADSCSQNCAGSSGACKLVKCGYTGSRQWSGLAYTYQVAAGNSNCGIPGATADGIACARRDASASAPYSNWGYVMNAQGVVTAYNGAPDAVK